MAAGAMVEHVRAVEVGLGRIQNLASALGFMVASDEGSHPEFLPSIEAIAEIQTETFDQIAADLEKLSGWVGEVAALGGKKGAAP
ncbi:hypothetical protein [Acidocella sp.]|uniref:hypothetical protein n=1 Tax=Acidocella sp. TaxID=50710 RepID=UPI002621F8DF|nr:hypothetical protein [Acidocella sp.]